jgi:2-iminobutanoate/2-iminopropanoate deaminase
MGKKCFVLPDMVGRPYSSAVKAGDYIFLSGTIGYLDEKGKEVVGIEAQTKQCLENLKRTLEPLGSSLKDVVKVTVFLIKAEDWGKMNEVYRQHFPVDMPARTSVITGLPNPKMVVEIECVAYHPSD